MALTKVSRGLLSTSIVDNGNATAITIDSSENVGLGTGSPAAKAHIYDAATDAVLYLDSANVNGSHARFLAGGSVKHFVGSGGGFGLGDVDDFAIRSFDNLIFATNNSSTERMRIDASGNVQIGTGTPAYLVGTSDIAQFSVNRVGTNGAITNASRSAAFINLNGANGGSSIEFSTASANNTQPAERMRIDGSGRLGLGVTPEAWHSVFKVLRVGTGSSIAGESGGSSTWFNTNAYYDGSWKRINNNTSSQIAHTSDGKQEFKVAASGSANSAISWNTAMTVDNSGNVLVGTSSDFASGTVDGIIAQGTSKPAAAFSNTASGQIVKFYQGGSLVGNIGATNSFFVGQGDTGLGFFATDNLIFPADPTNVVRRDNAIDLGYSAGRFDDIYATNGTIQTSDRNEKQDIAELSDAEQRVAVAAKGLLRKFRWKDSVAEKGDEARTHFGIIAQDLQAAFAAEGLDAGDYAMFISSTWTDEETNEEKTRMGVRYSELLAFIIAAI